MVKKGGEKACSAILLDEVSLDDGDTEVSPSTTEHEGDKQLEQNIPLYYDPCPVLTKVLKFETIYKRDHYAQIYMKRHMVFAAKDTSCPSQPFLLAIAESEGLEMEKLIKIKENGQYLEKLERFSEPFEERVVLKTLKSHYPTYTISPLKDFDPVRIYNLEGKHPQNWMTPIQTAIIYAPEGVINPLEMFLIKHRTERFERFLSSMGITFPFTEDTCFEWKSKKLYWYVTTELSQEAIRRLVGNSINVIFFHESLQPFDPALVDSLGKLCQSFIVVKPWEHNSYRVGFFHKINTNFGPFAFKNYLFDSSTIKDFILTKVYNSLITSRNYPPFDRLYKIPRAVEIMEIIDLYLPRKYRSSFCEKL
eukprot:TRINITY_DN6590_c0_g1_i6.p1 TRINITY_DN6590_c0_g1~~TRINITY_DN6590_c0_g1_i6.p1  ORF type:complete len:364 (+),score=69.26 TRINITY_DN6590_c0_g1_i6:609-1700(+)